MENRENRRVLYICHDGDLYGSQQSLALMVKRGAENEIAPFVSIARQGPLNEMLAQEPTVTVLAHKRLQWVKHDRRSLFQKLGDVLALAFSVWPRGMALARLIKQHEIQLVHTNSMVSLEGGIAAWLAGVPHVWHVRELFMEENPKLNMVLGRSLTRWLIHRFSSGVLCNSKAVLKQFGSLASDKKYRVIYNAVAWLEPEEESLATKVFETKTSENKTFRLGYVGRLSAGKRFQDLVEAMGQLKSRGIETELVVAGRFVDEPFEKMITEQIQNLGLQEQIHFLGYVEDLEPVYKSLDLLVLPSLNEPFGRVLIEAMLAEVPCVAADSGGVPEIIDHEESGLLYPPKNVDALAETLERAMKDPELLKNLCNKAGRVVRERFTIEAQMKSLVECYHAIF